MNEIARPQIQSQEVTPISMMFDPIIASRVMAVAETMAKGKITVPEHLRGNVGDCLAIVMQAASWKLNPFLVAQKTFMIHGKLSYEAQLVSAIVSSLGILDGRFSYEYKGDWKRIAKRPRIQKGPRGDYPTPGWREQDEDGLSIVVKARIKGDPDIRMHELFLASVWPRNSTLWATAPQQQIAYLATKQWVRRYAPDAILGVYTPDEVEQEHIVDGERIDTQKTSVSEKLAEDARTDRDVTFIEPETDYEPKKKSQETEEFTRPVPAPVQDREPESPAKINEQWPQEIDGQLIDIDRVVWDERIHSVNKSCTKQGFWRKRRGVSDETVKAYERRPILPSLFIPDETKQQQEQQQEQAEPDAIQDSDDDTPPSLFTEAWFNTGISQAGTMVELDEYEDVLNDADLHPEVKTGIEHKIAARRAEIGDQQ